MGSLTSGNVGAPSVPTLNTGGYANQVQGAVGSQQDTFGGVGGSVLPQAQTTTNNLVNNPFASNAVSGAQTGASLGTAGAQTNFNTGQSLVPYAQSIINSGFDPQNALFAQEQQQVRDQANVTNAQSGVATTPYGAGTTNQALTNFDIDWQNNQLSRNIQAAQGAGQLDQTASGLYTPAGGQYATAAALPYATYSDIGTGQDTALSQLLGITTAGQGISQTNTADLLSLLTGGNTANSVANSVYGNQLTGAQNQFNDIGQLASAGAGLFGLV